MTTESMATDGAKTDGFELLGFSSTLALEVLAELGTDLDNLVQGGARGRLQGGALGSEPRLFLPGGLTQSSSGEPHPVYARLLEILELRAPHFERHELEIPQAGAGWWRLDQALPLLMLESSRDDEAAAEEEGEWLLIDRRGDTESSAKLVSDLRFHATHCRMAATTTSGGQSCLLVHVLADPERKPSLGGLTAAGALDDLDRLACFRSAERAIFLGGERVPSRRGLAAFCQIMTSLSPVMASSERLLAIVPREAVPRERKALEIYPLAGLDFLDQVAITPRPSAYAEIEVLPLSASDAELHRLQERILRAEPRVGHRLELRPGFPLVGSDRELEHLVAQLAELEQRRAYLESLRQPRPVLLRFTQHQLPALADAIRSFPSLEVRDGKIFYAFEATQANPAGWHYLLFNPAEAVQSEPYPPWRWAELAERIDDLAPRNETPRFWLDPLWADDYHDRGDCLVFVPQGRVLFPSLHSWKPDGMDVYLRDLLREWFPGQRGIERWPARALLLFDEIRPPDQKDPEIRIQVLDADGFVPLSEQIGWINDNLSLQHVLGGVQGLVSELAEQESRRLLAVRFAAQAEQAEAAFEAAATATNVRVAEGATELLDVMTDEIARIAERCRLASEEIPRMHALLEETAESLEQLKKFQGQVGGVAGVTSRRVEENLHWVGILDGELARLKTERDQVETRARRAIRELEERYRGLLEQLRW